MHNLNWDDYRYFLAISRKRCLTKVRYAAYASNQAAKANHQ